MKKILFLFGLALPSLTNAQKIEKIFVHLYTDSLKKGTYNYINIDGQLSDGNYIPLDSSEIKFWASDGKFYGNSLLIDKDFKKDKVQIKATLKTDPAIEKAFYMSIKKKEDTEHLKTNEEIMKELQNDSKIKTKKKYSTPI